jgi:hypothetical protein
MLGIFGTPGTLGGDTGSGTVMPVPGTVITGVLPGVPPVVPPGVLVGVEADGGALVTVVR